jgi:DNA-binding transcriptional ArsR family regulator
MTISTVGRHLRELVAAGVAREARTGAWVLVDAELVGRYRVDVVEFKLTDWRKALAQACRYRSMADTVTVVMPQSIHRLSTEGTSAFVRYGVGLISYSPDTGAKRTLVRARRLGPLSVSSKLDALGRAALRLAADPVP